MARNSSVNSVVNSEVQLSTSCTTQRPSASQLAKPWRSIASCLVSFRLFLCRFRFRNSKDTWQDPGYVACGLFVIHFMVSWIDTSFPDTRASANRLSCQQMMKRNEIESKRSLILERWKEGKEGSGLRVTNGEVCPLGHSLN